MTKKIVAFMGYSGSGKDTAAEVLISEYNFKRLTFATPLKDVVSAVFKWPRSLLEGKGKKSRQWRDTEDAFWTEKLGFRVTPRIALEKIGTDLFRNQFNSSIWTLSLEKEIYNCNKDIVITDVRFIEEYNLLKGLGAVFISVYPNELPSWHNTALSIANGNEQESALDIHVSQYKWLSFDSDHIIKNNSTIKDLHIEVINKLSEYLS